MRPARWLVSVGTLMPRVVDQVMGVFARDIGKRARGGTAE
jgi:hypothetical protein